MPEAEQTVDGDYEFISYYTFRAVDYDRQMSWKAGPGWIAYGVKEVTSRRTDAADEEKLAAGQTVIVSKTDFKLVRK